MPLIKSASRKAVGQNITTEEAAGKPRRQAIAIALNTADRAKQAPNRSRMKSAPSFGEARHPQSHAEFMKLGDD